MLLSLCLLLAAMAAPAPAKGGSGMYFEQTTVPYVSGRAAGPGVASRVWAAGRKMRLETGAAGGPAFILRLDSATAYRIEPAERRAVAVDATRLRARAQLDTSMAGDLMGVAEVGSARSVPLATSRTIAGRTCRGFRISAGSTVMDVFVSADLPLGVDLFADFLAWTGSSQAMAGLLDEIRKLPGFPLETRTRVTVLDEVHEIRSTITALRTGPQPDALFEPPAGYTIVAEEPPSP